MPTPISIDPSWRIFGKPHGGYLLRFLAAAALDEQHPDPLAVSAHFLTAAEPGPAVVEAERLRTGRRTATTRVRLVQADGLRAEALVTAGALGDADPVWADPAGGPAVAPPEECLQLPSLPPGAPESQRVGHLDHLDVRLDKDSAGWAFGSPSRRGELRAQVRMGEDVPTSALDLLVLLDALPPVTLDLGLTGWAPTVEMSLHVRRRPRPGWLRAVQRSRLVRDGWFDEDCELWDDVGLVAQARQLAGYREPAS